MMNSTLGEFAKQSRPATDLGSAPSHSGRRPGESGTRDAIREAARRQFAEQGYDRATLRSIAAEAGVDPALVAHFFGTKQRLFVAVIELPFAPALVMPELLAGDRAGVGQRVARFILSLLEEDESRERMVGLVRSAASEPEAARLVRDLVTRELFAPMTAQLSVEDAALRAALVGAQVVGLVMARYVVGVEPLASADPETVIAALAPNFQQLLTGPLPAPAGDEAGSGSGRGSAGSGT
jgi:AcrR family transcriptional regulator